MPRTRHNLQWCLVDSAKVPRRFCKMNKTFTRHNFKWCLVDLAKVPRRFCKVNKILRCFAS
jgi:hypothetical protein